MQFEINSKKHGIKKILIDDEDWNKIKNFTWGLDYRKDSDSFYVKAMYSENKKHKSLYLHRFILDTDSYQKVDHINHNKLDYRKSNLRICTHQENNRNKEKQKNNTSGYKGVVYFKWGKRIKRWKAQITIDSKKNITLGYFDNKIEAAKSYNDAAIKYFGEFACINKIYL